MDADAAKGMEVQGHPRQGTKRAIGWGLAGSDTASGRHKATLYALTFYAIDDCKGKLDVKATGSPRGTWKKNEPLPPLPKLKVVSRRAG